MKLMKSVFAVALVAALAMAVAPTFAADEAVEVTLSGEPVDITCYLGGKSGEAHAGCATACANKGNPIGLVVEEGDKKTLYLVLGAGAPAKDLLAAHMGKIVDVTGKASAKEGMHVLVASAVAEAGAAEEEEWFPEEVVGGASVIVD